MEFGSCHKFPQSQFADEAVKGARKLLTRTDKDGSDVYFGLLLLRNAPRDGHLKSPSDRLFLVEQTLCYPLQCSP